MSVVYVTCIYTVAIIVGGRRKTFYSLIIEYLDLQGSVYKITNDISKQLDFVTEEGFSARKNTCDRAIIQHFYLASLYSFLLIDHQSSNLFFFLSV